MLSEQLAALIVELLAIVVRADGVDEREPQVVRGYLTTLLNHEMVEQYMAEFDELVQADWQSADQLESVCTRLNAGLTSNQKVRLMVVLFSLVNADGQISELERALIYNAAEFFNLSFAELGLIERFVFLERASQANHKHFLLLSAQPLEKTERGNEPVYWQGLQGMFAIVWLQTVNLWMIKYLGRELYYLDGAPMLHNQPQELGKGSSIRGGAMAAIHYAEVIRLMFPPDQERKITFVAEKVSYSFQNGQQAIHTLDIHEQSGHLVGIMGPSGSGKSTLLELLIGLRHPSTGQVRLNGYDVHRRRKATEGLIGYVPQDDMLMEHLTVFQNLFYAAKLSFANKSEDEITSLVHKTLAELDISHIANKEVGSRHDRYISGGERKRLNIGMELLRSPAVLFLDEPTSGLSSRDSLSIMDLLKELTLQGQLIFVVIHQPSSDIFKLFDHLLILDKGGYPVYYGDPVSAVVYFKQCIHQVNAEVSMCPTCANINPEQVFDIIEGRTLNHIGQFTTERRIEPATWYSYFRERLQKPQSLQERKRKIRPAHLKPTLVQQWLTFLKRDALGKWRNGAYVWLHLLTAPLLALGLSVVNRNSGAESDPLQPLWTYSYAKNENIPAYLFMSAVVAIFLGLNLGATEILGDRKLLRREHFLHLSRLGYLASKVTVLFLILAFQMAVYALIGNWVLAVPDFGWRMWSVLFPLSCASVLTSLILSSVFKTAVTVYILIPILIIPQILLGGAVIPYERVYPWLLDGNRVPWVAELIPARWGFEALMVAEFTENDYMRRHYIFQKRIAEADVEHNSIVPQLQAWHQHLMGHLGAGTTASTDSGLNTEQMMVMQRTLVNHLNHYQQVLPESLRYNGLVTLNVLATSTVPNTPNGYLTALKIWQPIGEHLNKISEYYAGMARGARALASEYQTAETLTNEQREALRLQLLNTHNTTVDKLLRNTQPVHALTWHQNHWYPQVYPALLLPEPRHALDWRSHFFAPRKHIVGQWVSTPLFNVWALWLLSAVLFALLYTNLVNRFLKIMRASG